MITSWRFQATATRKPLFVAKTSWISTPFSGTISILIKGPQFKRIVINITTPWHGQRCFFTGRIRKVNYTSNKTHGQFAYRKRKTLWKGASVRRVNDVSHLFRPGCSEVAGNAGADAWKDWTTCDDLGWVVLVLKLSNFETEPLYFRWFRLAIICQSFVPEVPFYFVIFVFISKK